LTAEERTLCERLTFFNGCILNQQYLLNRLILNLLKDDSCDELLDKEGRNELPDQTAAATVLESKEMIACKL